MMTIRRLLLLFAVAGGHGFQLSDGPLRRRGGERQQAPCRIHVGVMIYMREEKKEPPPSSGSGRERYVPSWAKRDAAAQNIYAEARSEYEEYERVLMARKAGSSGGKGTGSDEEDTATRDPSPPASPPSSPALPPPMSALSSSALSSLPSVRDAAGASTTAGEAAKIVAALEPLAAALAPHKTVVECGGGGTCGPNSLGCALAHAGLHDGSGDDVRRRVVAHAAKLVRGWAMWCEIEETSVRELIESSFATWARPRQSVNRVGGRIEWDGPRQVLSAENWLKLMAKPTTWMDQAFLALAADCFAVDIAYYVVSSSGRIRDGKCVVKPRTTVDVQAEVELAYVVDQHFCAVVPA